MMISQGLIITLGEVMTSEQDLYIYEIEVELFLTEDVAESDEIEGEIEATGQEQQ